MERVLLISKAAYPDTPIVTVRVLSYDSAKDEIMVEGRYGHRWTMTKAEAKAGFDRFVQGVHDGVIAAVQEGLQARVRDSEEAGRNGRP
jgi:hypothetical protein